MILQTILVSLLGLLCPGHTGHCHVLADGSQGHLELDGTLYLCLCDHGLHVGKEQGTPVFLFRLREERARPLILVMIPFLLRGLQNSTFAQGQ